MKTKTPKLLLVLLAACACCTLSATPSYADTPPTSEMTGSMANARNGTATLLPNGKVLAVKGDGTFNISDAELYDPSSGSWSGAATPTEVRIGHTATLLRDGRVLVAGSISGLSQTRNSAELYDQSKDSWTKTGSMASTRAGHAAALLPGGTVLVAGGFIQDTFNPRVSIAKAEIYDPQTGSWTVTGDMAANRTGHTATLLPSGKVLVAGGWDGYDYKPTYPAITELYDPATKSWSATGSLNHPRVGHTATLLPNSKVLIAGGNRLQNGNSATPIAELYDPATGTWTDTGTLVKPRVGHTATLLPGNKVLVTGGVKIDAPTSTVNDIQSSAELYDPSTGTWTSTGSLLLVRDAHTATMLANNKVLIAAGETKSKTNGARIVTPSAELYTPLVTRPMQLNISTRLRVENGDNAMIGGFIITGNSAKTVIVRGIGPSLGMTGALQDPTIEVRNSSGVRLASNDNWKEFPNQQAILNSGLAPTNDLESVFWAVLDPGAYTVIVRGKNGATGIGVFEVYDLNPTWYDSTLANISTRGVTETGDDVMIGGLIVGGGENGTPAKIVVRALGPSIPMSGTVADPTLELRDGNGILVASNDDWKTRPDGSSQQAEIEATTLAPANERESALVQMLGPNQYTAIVRGKNDTTRVALVEVYNFH